MRARDFLVEDGLRITDDTLDHFSGQTNTRLTAWRGVQRMGHLDYSVYRGLPHVQMIEVLVRRQGVGSALLRHLQGLFPDEEIDLGMLTDDGAKLVAAMSKREIIDTNVEAMHSRLDLVKAKIASIENQSEHTSEELTSWNTLYDVERKLEDQLRGRKMRKRIFI